MSTHTKRAAGKEIIILRPDMHLPRWESVLEEAAQAPTILIVDDIDLNRRLLRAMLKTANYRILDAKRPSAALGILEREKVDLVVVDLVMPEMSGPDFCRSLKNDRKTQLIPILMTTSVQGAENEVAGIESGADEFLIKPLQPTVVRTRIRAMLRNKALVDSLEEAETILFALAQSVEHRDKYTGLHCERLATYSIALGQALGLPRQDQLALYRGGYLHDIGKISIPDAILFKRGLLTDEEWQTMRLHTIRGEEICRPMKIAGAGAADHPQPSRALGRHRLSRRSGGRGDSAAGADSASRRYLRRADHRASLQARVFAPARHRDHARGGAPRLARSGIGAAVRRGLPAGIGYTGWAIRQVA